MGDSIKTTKIKEMLSSIACDLLILFLPLSPLHLASYYSFSKEKEREERLKSLSKKMFQIASRFEKEEKLNSLDNINYVELFHMVYHQINNLTTKELKILRDFCYTLYNPYDLRIKRDHEIESENDIYKKYKGVLDDVIEENTKRKSIF